MTNYNFIQIGLCSNWVAYFLPLLIVFCAKCWISNNFQWNRPNSNRKKKMPGQKRDDNRLLLSACFLFFIFFFLLYCNSLFAGLRRSSVSKVHRLYPVWISSQISFSFCRLVFGPSFDSSLCFSCSLSLPHSRSHCPFYFPGFFLCLCINVHHLPLLCFYLLT